MLAGTNTKNSEYGREIDCSVHVTVRPSVGRPDPRTLLTDGQAGRQMKRRRTWMVGEAPKANWDMVQSRLAIRQNSSLAHIHKGPRMVTNHGHRRCTLLGWHGMASTRRQPRTNCWCALIFRPDFGGTRKEVCSFLRADRDRGRRETRAFADGKKKHDSSFGRRTRCRLVGASAAAGSAAPRAAVGRTRRGKKIRCQIAGGLLVLVCTI